MRSVLKCLARIDHEHSLIAERNIRLSAVSDDNVGVAVKRERSDHYSCLEVAYVVDMDIRVDSVRNKEIVSDNGRLTRGGNTADLSAALLCEVICIDCLRALDLKRVIHAAVGE